MLSLEVPLATSTSASLTWQESHIDGAPRSTWHVHGGIGDGTTTSSMDCGRHGFNTYPASHGMASTSSCLCSCSPEYVPRHDHARETPHKHAGAEPIPRGAHVVHACPAKLIGRHTRSPRFEKRPHRHCGRSVGNSEHNIEGNSGRGTGCGHCLGACACAREQGVRSSTHALKCGGWKYLPCDPCSGSHHTRAVGVASQALAGAS